MPLPPSARLGLFASGRDSEALQNRDSEALQNTRPPTFQKEKGVSIERSSTRFRNSYRFIRPNPQNSFVWSRQRKMPHCRSFHPPLQPGPRFNPLPSYLSSLPVAPSSFSSHVNIGSRSLRRFTDSGYRTSRRWSSDKRDQTLCRRVAVDPYSITGYALYVMDKTCRFYLSVSLQRCYGIFSDIHIGLFCFSIKMMWNVTRYSYWCVFLSVCISPSY